MASTQLALLKEHLHDRNAAGSSETAVQEFIRGVEVGAHLVATDGVITVRYTRKDFTRGNNGFHSEETGHRYDPADPIHEVCVKALDPMLQRILQELGVRDTSLNADIILPASCFDRHGNLTTTDPAAFKDSCILEIHFRPGGEALQKMLGEVFETDYEKLVVASSLGQVAAVNELHYTSANNTAMTATLFADYDGYVLAAPHTQSLRKVPGIFYSNAQRHLSLANEPLTTPDQFQPTKDWTTKAGRPVIGVVVLSHNMIVSYDAAEGGYVREPIGRGD